MRWSPPGARPGGAGEPRGRAGGRSVPGSPWAARSGVLAVAFLLAGCPAVSAPADPGDPPLDPGDPPPGSPLPFDTTASPLAAPWKGETLRVEAFADGAFEARGWYDGPRGRLEAGGPPGAPEGARHFLCHLPRGANVCAEGTPGRLALVQPGEEAPEGVYLSYLVRYDAGWRGSERAYHPHEWYFLTTLDPPFIGPAQTHLTVYVEQTGGRPFIGIQDNRNVHPGCILRNDDQVVGCDGGRVEDFPFGENRSVASCNGVMGDLDARDCYPSAASQAGWTSTRAWRAPGPVLSGPGPAGSDGWRRVEAVILLNRIVDGVGVPDGRIRLWVDGEEVVASDRVLFRTGRHPDMGFHHLLLAPYIGDGSPVDQRMRLAQVVVARAHRLPE